MCQLPTDTHSRAATPTIKFMFTSYLNGLECPLFRRSMWYQQRMKYSNDMYIQKMQKFDTTTRIHGSAKLMSYVSITFTRYEKFELVTHNVHIHFLNLGFFGVLKYLSAYAQV